MPGSGPDLARFEDRTRLHCAFFDIEDLGHGELDFRIELGAAAIESPALGSPTRLTTSFRLDDGQTVLVVGHLGPPWERRRGQPCCLARPRSAFLQASHRLAVTLHPGRPDPG